MKKIGVANANVLRAISHVQREAFLPVEWISNAYVDLPLPIDEEQTISQPSLVAFMTEQLNLRPQDRVLEIGTGSGYQTAVLAEIAAEVYTIEVRHRLSEKAQKILKKLNYKNIQFLVANGMLGWPSAAPFDAIIVTAAATEIPHTLTSQLKIGGRMVIPINIDHHQELTLVEKTEVGVNTRTLLPVRFVPIVPIDPNAH